MASATAIPSRPKPKARAAVSSGVAEIYIGGAADGQSRLVASFVQARQRTLQAGPKGHGRTASWFAHYDTDSAQQHCRDALARGDQIVLVGHSWGGDTALRIAHQLHGPIALLAGVDPVMRPGTLFSSASHRPENAETIIYVDARPRQLDHSDIVKATGVILAGGLAPAYREADVTVRTDLNHWAFADMMAAPGADGLSLKARIHEAAWQIPASRAG